MMRPPFDHAEAQLFTTRDVLVTFADGTKRPVLFGRPATRERACGSPGSSLPVRASISTGRRPAPPRPSTSKRVRRCRICWSCRSCPSSWVRHCAIFPAGFPPSSRLRQCPAARRPRRCPSWGSRDPDPGRLARHHVPRPNDVGAVGLVRPDRGRTRCRSRLGAVGRRLHRRRRLRLLDAQGRPYAGQTIRVTAGSQVSSGSPMTPENSMVLRCRDFELGAGACRCRRDVPVMAISIRGEQSAREQPARLPPVSRRPLQLVELGNGWPRTCTRIRNRTCRAPGSGPAA